MIPGYVLAGGRSSRMGQDKAFVLVGGRPMAVRVARAMIDVGLDPVQIVGKQLQLARLGLPLVLDQEPLPHPLVGVVAALAHAETLGADRALVCPCDLPFLSVDALLALLALGGPAMACADGRHQPLLAVLPVALRPALHAAALAGVSTTAALRGLPMVEVSSRALRNVNHPHELPGPEEDMG